MPIDPTLPDVTDNGPTTEIRISRTRMALATLGAIGLGAAYLWLTTRDGWIEVVGWAGLPFILVGIVFGAKATVRPKVVVTLDDRGVTTEGTQVSWRRIVDVPINGNLGGKAAWLRLGKGGDIVLPTSTRGGPDAVAEQVKSDPRYRGER